MEKKDWKKKLRELSFMKGYYFKLEDNGLVEKKDDQLVFNREELEHFVQQELDKAREEGRREYFSMGMEYFSLIEDSNIYQQKGWKLPEEKAKRLQILDKIFNLTLKTKEDGL